MQTWFTIARWPRLTVRLHYTWFIVLILGTWTIGQLMLPQRLTASDARWLPALAIMVIFVASVFLHEAAHLLTARLLRVPMPKLNIHPIGTLARLGSEDAGPLRTFTVAAAGPLLNLGLWWLLRSLDYGATGTALEAILAYGATINLALAAINILPGLPLDGGRMFRAVMWAGSDYWWATRVAMSAGTLVSAGIFILALRSISQPTGLLRGLWLVLLAWLIYDAGASLRRRRSLANLFMRLKAQDVMTPALATVGPDMTLRELTTSWHGHEGENATPVVRNGRLLGMITRSDTGDVPQGYWDERTVGDTMRPINDLLTFKPDVPLLHVLPYVDIDAFRPLPVLITEHGELKGLVEPREVIALIEVQEAMGLHHRSAAIAETQGTSSQRVLGVGDDHHATS